MTTQLSVDNDIAHQVLDAMDNIRASVWHDHAVQPHWRDRLVDADGLEAQRTRLEEMKLEFQQAVKFPERFRAAGSIRCDEVDCGDGTWERMEFWQLQESQSKARLVSIFEAAIHDIDFWRRELNFQNLWMDAASWGSCNGQPMLARRLEHAYRLFFGVRPIISQAASPFAPSGRTVRAVANEIRAKAFGHAVTEPKTLDWNHGQDAECILDTIRERQERVYRAQEGLGLLDDPFASKIGRQLDCAFGATSFKLRFYEVDSAWTNCIFEALKVPNLQLASALMRYYGHFFGTVYLVRGLRIDRPPLGSGHIPDDPTEEQAKGCLFDCNRLSAAWINRQEDEEVERAARERSQALPDAQVPDERGEQPDADVQP